MIKEDTETIMLSKQDIVFFQQFEFKVGDIVSVKIRDLLIVGIDGNKVELKRVENEKI